MSIWNIKQTVEFQDWFDEADKVLQEDTVEHVKLLEQFGPHLKRPHADTLKGSQLTNLKELRFNSRDKVIRIFFIFDPDRNAVLLIGGDKAGSGDKSFYDKMIDQSERIYGRYLDERKNETVKEQKKIKKRKKK
ncbi:Gp49-like PF05973 family protein [Bacteriovorax sp. BSW11_IV]|uniref:type II toxin-antitoxin system RelE/ParE family toxin n=1 Tax=Bacteriovorax sp. BSW11_IV TaxID=1353529 RepID=UPI000389DDEE|nr:type II toxin-antitoxin system RelE/ParE family toxin [Bacteriovorax sp. BSW11_IV]EQC48790.1 Gp49-like PF05973 family protein [Bacteriovorax sp. BSW11_IV]